MPWNSLKVSRPSSTLHKIHKQYPSAQGWDGAEVPYRDFVQQETDLCQLSGYRKKKNKQTHLDEPGYLEGIPDLHYVAFVLD